MLVSLLMAGTHSASTAAPCGRMPLLAAAGGGTRGWMGACRCCMGVWARDPPPPPAAAAKLRIVLVGGFDAARWLPRHETGWSTGIVGAGSGGSAPASFAGAESGDASFEPNEEKGCPPLHDLGIGGVGGGGTLKYRGVSSRACPLSYPEALPGSESLKRSWCCWCSWCMVSKDSSSSSTCTSTSFACMT
ncbi:hypothetical protein DIPPA_12111 [Diplonema papillatum]|nr:hypothetical protein DIPPA_12111 [Diplonema papillatum]